MSNFPQEHHLVMGLVPLADRFAGANVRTDIFNMENWDEITFQIIRGAGGVGTSKIYVNSCSANDGTGRSAIGYWYRTNYSSDTWSAWAYVAAASEYTIVAGANAMIEVRILSENLDDDDEFVELELDEVADGEVTGCIVAILTGGRYCGDTPATVLS